MITFLVNVDNFSGKVNSLPRASLGRHAQPPQASRMSSSSKDGTGQTVRRRNLTNAQRKAICMEKEEHPQLTQGQLAKWAKVSFDLPHMPTQATISNILAKKNHYLGTPELDLNTKRRKPVFIQALDDALLMYIRKRHERGKKLPSANRLKEKARHYAKKLDLDPSTLPEFSSGWIASFQKRNRLHKKYNRKRSRHQKSEKSRKSSRPKSSKSAKRQRKGDPRMSQSGRTDMPPMAMGVVPVFPEITGLDIVPGLSSHLGVPNTLHHMSYLHS